MQKKIALFFTLICFFSCLYMINDSYHVIPFKTGNVKEPQFSIQKQLETFYPVLDDIHIVPIVIANSYDPSLERLLNSISIQTYPHTHLIFIDNGSVDQAGQKGKKHLEEYSKKKSVDIITYDKKRSEMHILFEVIHQLNPKDIVLLLNEKNWIAHENVFAHLNSSYANPNVWMTCSRSVSYPSYQTIEESAFSDEFLTKKQLRSEKNWKLSGLKSFYAGLFQEIRLQDFLFEGQFIENQVEKTLSIPMVEMGPNNLLFLNEIAYVVNHDKKEYEHKEHLKKIMASDAHLAALPSYSTINQFSNRLPTMLTHRYQGDVVIFSEDSPLELYACLESIYLKLHDVNKIYVIYQGSSSEFDRAYLNLKSEFPKVNFLDVCDYPSHDFGSLLVSACAHQREGSPYVLLTDDHSVFDEKLYLHNCIKEMKRVHCDHFFLSLNGMINDEKALPHAIPINSGIYAWQMGERENTPHFGVTLCCKKKIGLETSQKVESFALFKQCFRAQLFPQLIGLFYEERKTLAIPPLAIYEAAQKKEWGHKFIEGYKIDLSLLICEKEDPLQGDYPLIKRDSKISRQL